MFINEDSTAKLAVAAPSTANATPAAAPTKQLAGKVAIVTGSTSGIGLGIAKTFAAQGCAVVLNGLGDPVEIEKVRSELATAHGVTVLYHGADMSKEDQIRDLAKSTIAKLGGIDIIVNNAGIQFVAPIESFPMDKWNAIISINLTAAFVLTQEALPSMESRGYGRVIMVSSAHGLVGSPNKSAYVSAKHGLVGLTKTIALEKAETPVTVNAICPGWVLTPMVEKQISDNAAKANITFDQAKAQLLGDKEPSKRFTTVEQLGGIALFLCSEAAANITGIALSTDGGWTAH